MPCPSGSRNLQPPCFRSNPAACTVKFKAYGLCPPAPLQSGVVPTVGQPPSSVLRIGSFFRALIVDSSSSSAPSVLSKKSAWSVADQFPQRHWQPGQPHCISCAAAALVSSKNAPPTWHPT